LQKGPASEESASGAYALMHLAVDLLVAKIPPDQACQWQAGGAGALKRAIDKPDPVEKWAAKRSTAPSGYNIGGTRDVRASRTFALGRPYYLGNQPQRRLPLQKSRSREKCGRKPAGRWPRGRVAPSSLSFPPTLGSWS
jgi:hypothetical protein